MIGFVKGDVKILSLMLEECRLHSLSGPQACSHDLALLSLLFLSMEMETRLVVASGQSSSGGGGVRRRLPRSALSLALAAALVLAASGTTTPLSGKREPRRAGNRGHENDSNRDNK